MTLNEAELADIVIALEHRATMLQERLGWIGQRAYPEQNKLMKKTIARCQVLREKVFKEFSSRPATRREAAGCGRDGHGNKVQHGKE